MEPEDTRKKKAIIAQSVVTRYFPVKSYITIIVNRNCRSIEYSNYSQVIELFEIHTRE